MTLNENVAAGYGLTEAVVAQYLWELGEGIGGADVAYIGTDLWTRAPAATIRRALPFFSEDRIRDALNHLMEEGILIRRRMKRFGSDRTYWYAFTDLGAEVMEEKDVSKN